LFYFQIICLPTERWQIHCMYGIHASSTLFVTVLVTTSFVCHGINM